MDGPVADEPAKTEEAIPKRWDEALLGFLKRIRFSQAVSGFERDILVMNGEYEHSAVPDAIEALLLDLNKCTPFSKDSSASIEVEQRKIAYVQDSVHNVSPSTMNRSISHFLAENRARSNRSNTEEFLRPSKRRRIGTITPSSSDMDVDREESTPTCARTDAIKVNRDIQMKFDLVKNPDGPLGKTMGGKIASFDMHSEEGQGLGGAKPSKYKSKVLDASILTINRHTGLQERFENIEEHLAIRFVPGPPEDLRYRLKSLEEHIIRLERDYPPWAALHFNQPRRGWPPPQRSTPVIIPAHLTVANDEPTAPSASTAATTTPTQQSPASQPPTTPTGSTGSKGKEKVNSRTKSSLYRAVMEKLEMNKALNEVAGGGIAGPSSSSSPTGSIAPK